MESRPAGAGAYLPARPGVQLASGSGGRDRFRPRAVAPRSIGFAGHDECLDPEARSSPDLRMYQTGLRDEHRGAAQLRCQHAVLARQSVPVAFLYARAAVDALSGSQRACLGADRRREYALHHVLVSSIAAAAAEDAASLLGRT